MIPFGPAVTYGGEVHGMMGRPMLTAAFVAGALTQFLFAGPRPRWSLEDAWFLIPVAIGTPLLYVVVLRQGDVSHGLASLLCVSWVGLVSAIGARERTLPQVGEEAVLLNTASVWWLAWPIAPLWAGVAAACTALAAAYVLTPLARKRWLRMVLCLWFFAAGVWLGILEFTRGDFAVLLDPFATGVHPLRALLAGAAYFQLLLYAGHAVVASHAMDPGQKASDWRDIADRLISRFADQPHPRRVAILLGLQTAGYVLSRRLGLGWDDAIANLCLALAPVLLLRLDSGRPAP